MTNMVEMELLGINHSADHPYPLVLLRHENRILPIVVGMPEARAILQGLSGEKPQRPMTHDLIRNLLAGLRGELRSLTIYKLEDDTFFAHLNVEQKNAQGQVEQVLRIDSRPSDGIAMAVRVNCPIYASEEVLEAAGQDASILEAPTDPDDDADEDEFEDDDNPF
jgi:bifunctional DNase/RNase